MRFSVFPLEHAFDASIHIPSNQNVELIVVAVNESSLREAYNYIHKGTIKRARVGMRRVLSAID